MQAQVADFKQCVLFLRVRYYSTGLSGWAKWLKHAPYVYVYMYVYMYVYIIYIYIYRDMYTVYLSIVSTAFSKCDEEFCRSAKA